MKKVLFILLFISAASLLFVSYNFSKEDSGDAPTLISPDCFASSFIYSVDALKDYPDKPYIYKDSNTGHWMCSKHGVLSKGQLFSSVITINETTYCAECYCEKQ